MENKKQDHKKEQQIQFETYEQVKVYQSFESMNLKEPLMRGKP